MPGSGGIVVDQFDAFVSYGHDDADWALILAENLHRAGLEVFLDKWEIAPGDVVVHQLERGLLNSRSGVLVVSLRRCHSRGCSKSTQSWSPARSRGSSG